jgi:hypothetical protein
MFFDEAQHLRSLPLGWTNLVPPDPFVTISAGRALFRTEDLLRLVQLCQTLDKPAPVPDDTKKV